MDEPNFEFTPEEREAVQRMIEAIERAAEIMIDWVITMLNAIHRAWELWIRFFMKQQLLEWRIPNRLANYVAMKANWWIAYHVGLRWFRNKLLAIE